MSTKAEEDSRAGAVQVERKLGSMPRAALQQQIQYAGTYAQADGVVSRVETMIASAVAAEHERWPLEAALRRAYYYTEPGNDGEWRGPDVDEFERWRSVAKVAAKSLLNLEAELMEAKGYIEELDREKDRLRTANGAHPHMFRHGDFVRKRSGSSWEGVVVGEYSTALTPEGTQHAADGWMLGLKHELALLPLQRSLLKTRRRTSPFRRGPGKRSRLPSRTKRPRRAHGASAAGRARRPPNSRRHPGGGRGAKHATHARRND